MAGTLRSFSGTKFPLKKEKKGEGGREGRERALPPKCWKEEGEGGREGGKGLVHCFLDPQVICELPDL